MPRAQKYPFDITDKHFKIWLNLNMNKTCFWLLGTVFHNLKLFVPILSAPKGSTTSQNCLSVVLCNLNICSLLK